MGINNPQERRAVVRRQDTWRIPGDTGAPKVRIRVISTAFVLFLAFVSFLALDNDQRALALPMYAVIAIAVMLVVFLWQIDGAPPYFDVGVVCVLVTSLYLAYPLFAFLVSGMVWTEFSDNRFWVNQPTPSDFSTVAWWGVVYLLLLALSYTIVRRYPAANEATPFEEPSGTAIRAIAAMFLCIFVYMQVIQIVFGVDLNPTYGADVVTRHALPLWLRQITAKLSGVGLVLQFGLVLLLVLHSDKLIWRWILWLWAAILAGTVVWVFGARSAIMFLVLGWLLAHQRLRRALRPVPLLVVALVVIAAALLYGVARDSGGAGFEESIFAASSEFQALYGTAYDFLLMRDSGMLSNVPWQIYLADILRLIPQQLLPFEKIDPGDWYLDLIGRRGYGTALMFGVISEAAVGLGLIELALRGVFVGVVLGLIHNWYARNATKFWPTVFYLWLCVWSYYTYRASTLYLLGHVLTIFLPAYIAVRMFAGEYKEILPPLRGSRNPRPLNVKSDVLSERNR